MSDKTSMRDLAEIVGIPDLPAEINTVVETWQMSGDIKVSLSRFVRGNEMWWRQVEQRGHANNLMSNEQVSLELALAQGWSIVAKPVTEATSD